MSSTILLQISTATTFYFTLLACNNLMTTTNGALREQIFSNVIPTTWFEKTNHLHFYFQDIPSGQNPTAISIAKPPVPYPWGFGNVIMTDDPLTEGPEQTSKIVGKAQGFYGFESQRDFAFLMVMNFAFVEDGEYNGSSISILGRNPIAHDREMPIVGGSGIFRFARGYASAHTVWTDDKGDATVEYDLYVYTNETTSLQQIS